MSADNDHLHRLVHSMTRAEKRYFKLYTSRHLVGNQSVHQLLFDAIAAMPAYDVSILHRQFAGQSFMRRFAITKRRLYEAVLDSLDAFHAKSSVDDEVRRMLHHVELLQHKALYADAAKVLRSARKLAKDHERHALLLQVAEWDRRFMERSNYAGITGQALAKHATKAEATATSWIEMDRLWQIKSETFLLLYHNGQAPGMQELEQLDGFAADPLLAVDAVLHSAGARFLHHHVRGALAYVRNNLPACEKELEAAARLLRTAKGPFDGEPGLLLGVIANLAQVRMRLGRHQEALEGFQEFRRAPRMMAKAPSPDLEMKLFVLGNSLQMSLLAVKGDFAQAVELVGVLEEGFVRYGKRISTVRRAELELQAAFVCLGAAQPGNALRWCNRLLGERGIDAHAELSALGRMLNLACLVELGKHDLLEYVVRNAQRAWKQHAGPFAMERVLLEHAQALARITGSRRQMAWHSVLAALEEVAAEPKESAALDQIDLITWARAKAEERNFAELVKEKWSQRPVPARRNHGKRAA
ncbi:MAG TPA: hypothetical protein PLY76_09040 [Flavobacteriales bacterium]|nr:hypothetical protein [Flavobacteriales bacterium]HRP82032.1 hypothetical protein [Flavobacteriales bacterium]